MKKYNVKIISNSPKGSELLEYWELEREHFTSSDYRNIIRGLTYFGAESSRYSNLSATVYLEGRELFSVKCLTTQNYPEITSYITAANKGNTFTLQRVVQVAA